MKLIFPLLTVIFTVISQVVLKYRINSFNNLPKEWHKLLLKMLTMLFDPYIIIGFGFAFMASICWMATLTKLELGTAYSFISATFGLVILSSVFIFNESMNIEKAIGVVLIFLGIFAMSKGL